MPGDCFLRFGAHVSHKGAPRDKWRSWVGGQVVHLDLNWYRFLVNFAPVCVFESCFARMCRHKGFECVRAGFFPLTWSADIRKCVQITIGSFKNRVLENTTKRRHGIILELQMWRYGHILGSFWQAILRKNMKKDVPEKHAFWKNVKMLVREL